MKKMMLMISLLALTSGCFLTDEVSSAQRVVRDGGVSVVDSSAPSPDATVGEVDGGVESDTGTEIDAGVEDTGSPDVLVADAGDAGIEDQGLPPDDTGVRDDTGVGHPDADPRDAGFADAVIPPRDTGPRDSGVQTDARPRDTGIHADAFVPTDTGFADAIITDTGVGHPDAFVPPDVGFPPDTMIVDAGFPQDSGAIDAGFVDSGPVPDAGRPDSGVIVPQMVTVQAGCFDMGSMPTEVGRDPDETLRWVCHTRNFAVSVTEVTIRQSASALQSVSGTSDTPWAASKWNAMAYLNQLSVDQGLASCYDLSLCTGTPGTPGFSCRDPMSGMLLWGRFYNPIQTCPGYRLPTEAEWEYAARGGISDAFPSGNLPSNNTGTCPNGTDPQLVPSGTQLGTVVWYCRSTWPNMDLQPVWPSCGRPLNPFGLCSPHGNAWEWVDDNYSVPSSTPLIDPNVIVPGSDQGIIRGGAANTSGASCRSARRLQVSEGTNDPYWGFRFVRTL